MSKKSLIPFFVADRPASFRILKGVLLKYPDVKVGLMTHALTSESVRKIFSKFPKGTSLKYGGRGLLENEAALSKSIIKMADSGIFSKGGCNISYEDLFTRYENMKAKYGVMIDVLRDPAATIKSANSALKAFKKKKYKFKLVAVAQGKSFEEYMECYRKLSPKFEYIAVGGLLRKWENTARFTSVRDEELLYKVLESIKEEFKPKWSFALGCYHPSRHEKFEEIGVWGSDYKGWIFNYRKRRELLSRINRELNGLESRNGFDKYVLALITEVKKTEEKLLTAEKQWREARSDFDKREGWRKVVKLRSKLDDANMRLFIERDSLVQTNNCPEDYKTSFANLKYIINKEEQYLRFKQVRGYIEENVYKQLT